MGWRRGAVEEGTDDGELVDALLEATLPDEVGGDVGGEGVASEAEEVFGVGERHAEGGGHAEDGILGGMAVGVRDEPGVGRTADAGGVVESDGIAAVDFADALLEPLGECSRIAGLQVGKKAVQGGCLIAGIGLAGGSLVACFWSPFGRSRNILTHDVIFPDAQVEGGRGSEWSLLGGRRSGGQLRT